MYKRLVLPVLHFFAVALVLAIVAAAFGITQHASINFGETPLAYKVDKEGPYVFYEDNQLSVSYIRGNRENGFRVDKIQYPLNSQIQASSYFPLDESTFRFTIQPDITSPSAIYTDKQPIIAVSDLEGNYKAFRDFLRSNGVISDDLSWNFGQGHLVLVGDMVDRGFSATQLLWLIYKLEQEAEAAGGQVHFILGNHEIKNMLGNVRSAADKYIPIAGFLGKSSADLLSHEAYLGRWLEQKNVVEMINGHLFVHGGLHPRIIEEALSIEDINMLVRKYYRQMYYPGVADETSEFLISTETGPAWYRGYFHDEVTPDEFNDTLAYFGARSVTVGHSVQFNVNNDTFKNLYAIDVKHPDDYSSGFPPKSSEGLYLHGEEVYRLLDNGEQIKL